MCFSGFSYCFPPGKPGKWCASLHGAVHPSHVIGNFFDFSHLVYFNTVSGHSMMSYNIISLVFPSQMSVMGILKVVCV